MRKYLSFLLAVVSIFSFSPSLKAQTPLNYSFDQYTLNWVKSNISAVTQLPYSFYIPEQSKNEIYQHMNASGPINGAIERTITQQGLDIYDGAVYQIILSMAGGPENLHKAYVPLDYYWQGTVTDFNSIRSGYPINLFVYDRKHPEAVSSDNTRLGQRGFIFRIINADGNFLVTDPMNGAKTLPGFPQEDRLHWVDWKPVAGENAWVVIAAMQLYHKKYYDEDTHTYAQNAMSVELRLSEELARAAIMLQSESGGIRMAPLGTHRNLTAEDAKNFTTDNWWYSHISTENNLSWYAAFRMLYTITGNTKYKIAMDGIEHYLHFVWDKNRNLFDQGAAYVNGQWIVNGSQFALDVQTWAIDCLGPQTIDDWFGIGTSYRLWQTAKQHAGVFDAQGRLLGVGFTDEHDRISVEWSAGALVAMNELEGYYANQNLLWAIDAIKDQQTMRQSMETLRTKVSDTQSAYSYSSKRGWIPFGWNSQDPQVMSLASTGWMMFVDAKVNPFKLISKNQN